MIDQTHWTDRKFEFNFPVGMFPNILERLRGTPARLEELLHLFPAKILTVRHDKGWSMQEHAGHLYDLDELHEGRIDDYLASASVLRAADMQNTKTNNANHNATSIDALLRNFRSARQHFTYRLEQLQDDVIGRVSMHPRLKQPMRLVDLTFFVAEHDDHHLARIAGIARRLMK